MGSPRGSHAERWQGLAGVWSWLAPPLRGRSFLPTRSSSFRGPVPLSPPHSHTLLPSFLWGEVGGCCSHVTEDIFSAFELSVEQLHSSRAFSVCAAHRILTSGFLPNLYRVTCLMFSLKVRVMFEVQDLKYATLATVSRCGMVWFSEDVLSTDMIFNNFLARLRSIPLDEGEDEAQRRRKSKEDEGEEAASPMLQVGAGVPRGSGGPGAAAGWPGPACWSRPPLDASDAALGKRAVAAARRGCTGERGTPFSFLPPHSDERY